MNTTTKNTPKVNKSNKGVKVVTNKATTSENKAIAEEMKVLDKAIKTAFKDLKTENKTLFKAFKNVEFSIKQSNSAMLKRLVKNFNPFDLYAILSIDELVKHRNNNNYSLENVTNYFERFLLKRDEFTLLKAEKINRVMKAYNDAKNAQIEVITSIDSKATKATIDKAKAKLNEIEINGLESIINLFTKEQRDKATKTTLKAIHKTSESLFKKLGLDVAKIEDKPSEVKDKQVQLIEVNEALAKVQKELDRKRRELAKLHGMQFTKVNTEKTSA